VHVGIVAVGLLPVAGARCFGGIHRLLALAGIGSSYGPNVMFALSVEFPTAGSAFNTKTSISSVADLDVSGVGNTPFLGYFDYAKCYKYSGSGSTGYFSPYASATLTSVTNSVTRFIPVMARPGAAIC
jgi:hypothetical protein